MVNDLASKLNSARETFNFFYSSATLEFLYALFGEHFPRQLHDYIENCGRKLVNFAYPYTQITIDEFSGEHMKRSEAFTAIQNYLSGKSAASAKRLKADVVKDSQSLVLSMDYNEEIADEFEGIKVWWSLNRTTPRAFQFSVYPGVDEKRYFKLTVHNSHKELIIGPYLRHMFGKGKTIGRDNRQRKLYCNNPSPLRNGYNQTKWSHEAFDHPATFESLAMEAEKKEEIKNDLFMFRTGSEYYARIGKSWKRGYLLYGPPGTGKSTLIAAMANLLEYDVYDLDLTAVKDNTELKRLLIETSNKSIITIEDIDCSLSLVLTGQRENNKEEESKKGKVDKEMDPITEKIKEEEATDSKVTLSGVLNFTDGLWSSCGGERIIVFTTNHVEKLDPALTRRGRMDKRIELSYCCFEAFKVLAKNYLGIDSHPLFKEIRSLLGTTKMTPADVAENLMPRLDGENEEMCLNRLIKALKAAKVEQLRKKAEEEASRPKEKRKRSNNPVRKSKRRTIR